MRHSLGDSMIAAVSYADIFDYPLTRDEVRYWAVGMDVRRVTKGDTRVFSNVRDRGITYVVLKGREHIVAFRRRRAQIAKKKWSIARKMLLLYRSVPTVQLIGVTGALAMDNATATDDIDVFIIARKGTVWITRLLVTVLSDIVGIRRHPGDRTVTDKVCLNMFMDESALALSAHDRDLFAAHEVLQMTPVWERNGAYGNFLRANRWVEKFLPNAWRKKYYGVRSTYQGVKDRNTIFSILHTTITIPLLRLIEPVLRRFQLRYMQKWRTKEVVTDTLIRFHPADARLRVKRELGRRCRKYNMPLDKFFYDR